MTHIQNRLAAGLAAAITLVALGFAPASAGAKQTSLDHRIFQTFKNVDGRTSAHEQNVTEIKTKLDKITAEIETLNEQLASLPIELADDGSEQERRELHGRLIHLSARYLNQAYKLVDSAAGVIAANLSDLATLAEEVRRTGDPAGGSEKLKVRIERNVAAGRSMRTVLLELRDWAQNDATLVNRFESLRRITGSLDRRITIDKARLAGRLHEASGEARNQRLSAIDRTVDRLGDMYAEVMAEKESLKDLRDEVRVAIQLGRLEMTREVAERAIPNLGLPRQPDADFGTLETVANGVARLNGDLLRATLDAPRSQAVAERSQGRLSVGRFTNF